MHMNGNEKEIFSNLATFHDTIRAPDQICFQFRRNDDGPTTIGLTICSLCRCPSAAGEAYYLRPSRCCASSDGERILKDLHLQSSAAGRIFTMDRNVAVITWREKAALL